MITGRSGAYLGALRVADGAAAERGALDCLDDGISVQMLYSRVIAPAMWKIGDLWETGAITIADEHLATAITHRVLAAVYTSCLDRTVGRAGSILMATAEGESHELGLRMAGDILELAGYDIAYLGAGVPLEVLIAAIGERTPDLVALSATLQDDLPGSLEATISALESGFPDIPVLVGGQGVGDGVLRDGRTVFMSTVEGLAASVAPLVAEPDGARAEKTFHPTPTDDFLWPSLEATSSDDRLLQASADSADLARKNARLAHGYRRLAYQDSLTVGPNRRAFDDQLAFLGASGESGPVSVLMLDLDDFKQINDRHGHPAGDGVLRGVARCIEGCLRDGDLAARLGGDEFALLLPRTDARGAGEVATRVLTAIEASTDDVPVTAAIGIAQLGSDPRRAVLEADLALYEAKKNGGNRAESFLGPTPSRGGPSP
jgi:diguanylate cyclase (GGDEF)-like protein